MAARMAQPFALVTVGLVGSVGVNVYVAQGQLDWHKHIDEDELFLVHEGGLRVETERGRATLQPREVLLVPKGVGHRSSSALRSTVILLREQILAERKNGHRTYLVTDGDEALAKARLDGLVNAQSEPYRPATAAVLDGYPLSVFLADGPAPETEAPGTGTLLYAVDGALVIGLADGPLTLSGGQFTILPPHTRYSLSAPAPATIVKFERP